MKTAKKPSDLTKKIYGALEENDFIGIAFVGNSETKTGSFILKADDGLESMEMLAECVKNAAKANELSPWHVMDALGYLLGDCPPPENITPALKEFADGSRALYEYENRSH